MTTNPNESKFEKGLKIAGKVLAIGAALIGAASQINDVTKKNNG